MIPTRIGQQFGGGYFTGINRIGQTAYAIIVEPERLQTQLKIKTTLSVTPDTHSVNDGWANTVAMNNAEHPAAQYCRSLTVGCYTDWYLPSRDELELCYRYLKPGTTYNTTSDYWNGSNQNIQQGTNLNSVPIGTPYTTKPLRTIVMAFYAGSKAAFDKVRYLTSTGSSTYTDTSLFQSFYSGNQLLLNKTYVCRVRAVRRVKI